MNYPMKQLIEHMEHIREKNREHLSGERLTVSDAVFVTLINMAKKYEQMERKFIKQAYVDGQQNGKGCMADDCSEDWTAEVDPERYMQLVAGLTVQS